MIHAVKKKIQSVINRLPGACAGGLWGCAVHLGEKIREARKRAGLSQADLAAAVGQSQGSVSFYEKGEREPDLDTLHKIAGAVGLTVGDFFGDELPAVPQQMSLDQLRLLGEFADLFAQLTPDGREYVRQVARERILLRKMLDEGDVDVAPVQRKGPRDRGRNKRHG